MTSVAVVGLGLIGGSAALALGARGFDRDSDVRARARDAGIETAESLEEAVSGARVVLTGVPTASTPDLLQRLAALAPAAILTDTASLKARIADGAGELPPATRFVAGHPMAGSHRRGIGAASADLFRNRPWALVRTARSDDASVAAVRAMVESAGARPVELDAARHDRAMTWVSHLPLSVAAALVRAASDGAGAGHGAMAGPGFLDTTRVAAQPTELALELALASPAALADAVDSVSRELTRLAGALRREDAEALRGFFSEAAASRREAD